jgi:hypothetical protein
MWFSCPAEYETRREMPCECGRRRNQAALESPGGAAVLNFREGTVDHVCGRTNNVLPVLAVKLRDWMRKRVTKATGAGCPRPWAPCVLGTIYLETLLDGEARPLIPRILPLRCLSRLLHLHKVWHLPLISTMLEFPNIRFRCVE